MRQLAYLFFFLLSTFLYSQEIQLTVIDSLNLNPVQEVIALDKAGQFLAKSNKDGLLVLNKNEEKIYITANGYQQKMFSFLENGPQVCKIYKLPEALKDVVISKKNALVKYGNLNLNHGPFTDSQVCRPEYKNLTCATKIIIDQTIDIAFYNFCIYDKNNNSPFNFQIYNDKNGLPEQVIYSQYVKNYKKGWNKIEIENTYLTLQPGTYYIAMQWIPLEDKSNVWIAYKDNDRVLYAVGQKLGINEGSEEKLESFIYKNNWIKMPRMHSGKKGHYTQYVEAFKN